MPDTPAIWQSETNVTPVPIGSGDQSEPQITQLANGNIFVAWTDNNATTAPAAGTDIVGRFYNPDGLGLGSPFQLNTAVNTQNEQQFELAAMPDGGWMLAYESNDISSGATNVVVERHDSTGALVSSQTYTPATGEGFNDPALAINSTGDAIIAWNVNDSSGTFLRYAFYDESSDSYGALGSNFLSSNNRSTDGGTQALSVAALTNDTFVVVTDQTVGSDTITGRLITASGGTGSAPFTISSSVSGEQNFEPDVAATPNGGFAVTWRNVDSDQDTMLGFFDANGASLTTSERGIDWGDTDNFNNEMAIAALPDGTVAIVLDNDRENDVELVRGELGVNAQQLGSTVNVNTVGVEYAPDVFVLGDGRIAVAWSESNSGIDVSLRIYDTRDTVPGPVYTPDSWQVGTPSDDDFVMTGDNAVGHLGNDTIRVTSVNDGDTVDGGSGVDWFYSQNLPNRTVIDLFNEEVRNEDGSVVMSATSFEHVQGGIRREWIIGDGENQFLYGGGSHDTIDGGSGNDSIFGEDGNDSLLGGGDNDIVAGGPGDDYLDGGDGADSLYGNDGDDTFNYGAGQDYDDIYGDGDTDLIQVDLLWTTDMSFNLEAGLWGNRFAATSVADSIENVSSGSGNDYLIGSSLPNLLQGNAGNDTLEGADGLDTLEGGPGNDFFTIDLTIDNIDGGTGDDSVGTPSIGGAVYIDQLNGTWTDVDTGDMATFTGIEFINGTFADDTIIGGDENTTIFGNGGRDSLLGSGGGDSINGSAGRDTIFGGAGDDTLTGGGHDNTPNLIYGGIDNDIIFGADQSAPGGDTLYGGDGDDTIVDATGNDLIYGDAGNDDLFGGDDRDSLAGGIGDDTLDGGSGNDQLRGNADDDTLFGGTGNDDLGGGSGLDELYGDDGNDYLNGGNDADSLYGGFGTDTLLGGDGDDKLFGGQNADDLRGNDGNDTVRGENGTDTLNGGAGDDRLIGGGSFDVFVFSGDFGEDTIGDYLELKSEEKIDLTGVASITDFIDLLVNHVSQVGDDILISAGGGNRITIEDALIGELNGFDFIF